VLIGEASIRLDAIADDLKKTINRDINEALAGVKIDSDPLVKMTQNLRKAELDLITAEDGLNTAHRATIETEAKLEDLRRSGTATATQIAAQERALTRARAEEAVAVDRVTVSNQKLAAAHGTLSKAQREGETTQKSWIRSVLGSSNVLDSITSKINIFGRRSKDAGDESSRTGRKIRDSGNDASGLGKVLDGVLGGAMKAVTGQFSAMGDVGSGIFTTLTSKAVLLPAALAPLLGVVGGLIIALPALAAVGGVALGAIALGMDGIKRAFKPLSDDIDALKSKVSASFESALAPAVAKMPALFGAATTGLQSMATALGGTVTQLTNMLTTSENLGKIRDLFNQTAQFIQGMQPGIKAFTQGFLNLASAVGPQLHELGAALGSILSSIGDAFNRLSQLGLVKPAIDGLAQVFRAIGTLLGPILELFGRLAATLQGPLATVITAIANGLQAAMPGIQAFADGIGKALTALAPALQAILPLVGQVAGLIGGVLGTAISVLAPPLTTLIQGLSAGLAPVLPLIAQAFTDLGTALQPVLQQLAGVLVDALKQLLPIVPQLLGAITQLAPVFLQLVAAVLPLIPPLVQLIATILPGLIRLWLLIEKPSLEFALTIVNQVVPALVSFLGIVQKVVTGVVNFFTDFDTNVSSIWDHIVSFFSGIADSIGSFFSGIGQKIVGWFQAGVDFLAGLPGKVGEWLASLPGIVGNALLEAGKAMLNAAIQGVEWVLAEFIALPFQIIFGLAALAQMLRDAAVSAFHAFIDGVVTTAEALWAFITSIPGRIRDGLVSLGTTLRDMAVTGFHNFVTGITTEAENAWTFIKSIPGRVRSGLSSLGTTLRDAAVNGFRNFIDGIVSTAQGVWSFVSSIPGRIWGALGDLGGMLFNAGKAIIQGLINGIKNAAGAVAGAIGDVLAKARKLLPFSPAKEGPFSGRGWTLYSGMAISEALAEGIRRSGARAISEAHALAGAVQLAVGAIRPDVALPTVSGGGPQIGDLTKGPASTATAQLLTLQALADALLAQGQTLPADLASAIAALRVVVSADEVSTEVKKVDQQNARRR
jgi:phage-related protein